VNARTRVSGSDRDSGDCGTAVASDADEWPSGTHDSHVEQRAVAGVDTQRCAPRVCTIEQQRTASTAGARTQVSGGDRYCHSGERDKVAEGDAGECTWLSSADDSDAEQKAVASDDTE